MATFPKYDLVTVPNETEGSRAAHKRRYALLGVAALLFSACGNATTSPNNATVSAKGPPAPIVIETAPGHYLTARQALYFNDVETSATHFLNTLQDDVDNSNLLRQSFVTQYYHGDIDKAAALGRQLESLNITVTVGREPATALAIQQQDWTAVQVFADNIAETSSSIGMAGLIKGWALVASGQGDAGITTLFEAGKAQPGPDGEMPAYLRFHAALMAEYLGNEAEAVQRGLALAQSPISMQLAFQLAYFLHRNGAVETANALVSERLSRRYDATAIQIHMASIINQPRPSVTENIAAGILNAALSASGNTEQRLLSARIRLALYLDPRNEFAHYMLAQQFFDLDKPMAVAVALDNIDETGPLGQPAILARYDLANDAEDFQRAAAIIQQAIKANPDSGYLYKLLGDAHRRDRDYAKGRDGYFEAINRGYVTSSVRRNLAIALERLGEDDAAEENFQLALELNPDDPFTLNYLGYWWAEEGRNLDEAITLIERAVALRPESGYFVDSLGWVHYQLGDLQRAVSYLEQATTLEPADAEITGHLGDVYWRLGRHTEARFKWRLAASLSDDAEERAEMMTRLKEGLPDNE